MTNNDQPVIKSKRGRKSKQELMQSLNIQSLIDKMPKKSSKTNENSPKNTESPKNSEEITLNIEENNTFNDSVIADEKVVVEEKVAKKRGRKPKGGKIVQLPTSNNSQKDDKPNVILHLKCSLKDLNIQNNNNKVENYNLISSNKHEYSYEIIDNDNFTNKTDYLDDDDDESVNKDANKEIWRKLKQLEHSLHINNVNNKKSACFWDTCEFDNPPVYIPKHVVNGTHHVYGCFCSPECAVAHLMDEKLDSSTKFERYHLLNNIYAKIYDYKQNIKPAPNPYYMLDKYCGNISIQDYRSLLRNERLFLIVDKPLTRIMPELFEDNDDFILNNKIIPTNNYQIRNKLNRKKQNKKTILNEKFGNYQEN